MKIYMKTPDGDVSYDIPAMKVQNYILKGIFDKNLLFLIPFYIFNHESRLKEYNTSPEGLEILKKEYGYIKNRLEQLCTEYKIDTFTRFTITKMLKIVLENLARKYKNVTEGVNEVWVEKYWIMRQSRLGMRE